eukprot:CAMPEP_0202760198 /NCGR_PEP_ID=MMETSP1388-20130828/18212_1 /ASSEMBLY_ACC=CAM_ASM_000864 /TAXON_ID=37098 /ORGANISM="Isochrysis sp, Strain CCMP1244" /LENGTH=104 /DNA_ID=CAMNT_0049428223 /DNA_START=14 /DNA_END=325 /DNA_ORIENTATION=+
MAARVQQDIKHGARTTGSHNKLNAGDAWYVVAPLRSSKDTSEPEPSPPGAAATRTRPRGGARDARACARQRSTRASGAAGGAPPVGPRAAPPHPPSMGERRAGA